MNPYNEGLEPGPSGNGHGTDPRDELRPADLFVPEKRGYSHGPMAGRDEKAVGEFLEDADEMRGWSKLVIELKTLSETAGDAWGAVLRLFDHRRAEEVKRNRSYNETLVDPAVAALWAARDAELAAHDQNEKKLLESLSEAELKAAEAASKLLLPFDTESPDKARTEAVAPLSIEAHSFEEKAETRPEKGANWLAVPGSWAASTIVGGFFGVTLAGALGALSPPDFQGDAPLLIGAWVVLGTVLVAKACKSIDAAFRLARSCREFREDAKARAKSSFQAYATLACILTIETAVEAKGLLARDEILAGASFDGSSHSSPALWIFAVASAVSTFYGVCAAYGGWTAPSSAAANRVLLARETEAREIRFEGRKDPATVELFAAANRVDVLRAQLGRIATAKERTEVEFAKRGAVLLSRMRSEDPALPADQYKVLRQLLDEIRGRSADYYRLLRLYLEHIEGKLRAKRWWHSRGRN